MSKRSTQFFVTLVVAAGLVILPTIGSRGMGTMGERFVHADRPLFEPVSTAASAEPLLRVADDTVDHQIELLVARPRGR